MRFSAAALLALAATVVANDDLVTLTETEYTTYCPSSSGIPQVSSSVPAVQVCSFRTLRDSDRRSVVGSRLIMIIQPTQVPSGYTTTRPLITSTVTRCNEWYVLSPPPESLSHR